MHPGFRLFDFGVPNNRSIQAVLNNDAFVVDFSVPVTNLSVDFYDGGADVDVVLEAFSGLGATGMLLDSDTTTLPNISTMTQDTMTVVGASIRSVRFDSNGTGGQSVSWDNLTVTLP